MKRYVSAFGILKVEESMEKLNSEIIADCALWPLWSPDNICCNFSNQTQNSRLASYPHPSSLRFLSDSA
jgi:hypothetical protein